MIFNKDEEKMKFAKEVADLCGTIEGERCQQANSFVECLHEKVKIRNIDILLF
jgi:hypothetical protein